MRCITIYQVDSFTTAPLRGNPAGVVPHAQGLDDNDMRRIARELNNSETAFIFPPDAPDHEVRLRFFTPTVEVPSCGHATIAAHYIRAMEMGLPDCRVMQKIGAGILPVDIRSTEHGYHVTMTQGAISISPDLPEQVRHDILAALGVDRDDHDPSLPMRIASTGHSKVMVSLRRQEVLHALNPDLSALATISRDIGCNGFHAFVFNPQTVEEAVHGRMFAPAIGIAEDPVTGNANGPLGAYLSDLGFGPDDGIWRFTAVQGQAIDREGRVEVGVTIRGGTPVSVTVGGHAVVAFKAEIRLA